MLNIFVSSGAAKVAFERCVQIEQIADERGSYYKEVHYNYDYVEDFQDIFSDEGPKVSDCDDEGKQTQQKKHQRREQSYGNEYTTLCQHKTSIVL